MLPEGAFKPANAWMHAVYKVAKNGKKPAWEASYEAFSRGGANSHPSAIAMNQESGKPIQTQTVVGHVLEAMGHGRAVDLRRLAEESGACLPNAAEWASIEEAVVALGVDVVKDAQVPQKVIMLAAAGRVEVPPEAKTEEDKKIEGVWYERVKWYLQLKRCGVPVRFDTGEHRAKRQRT